MSARVRRLYDVSRRIDEKTAVWPGDTVFARRHVMTIAGGCSCNVSTVTLSLHTGTHADAPSHYVEGAPSIDQVDLSRYVGLCRVLTPTSADALRPADLAGLDLAAEERILVRSPRPLRDDEWRDDFFYCSAEAADLIARSGLRLLGLESPSMDFMQSKELRAHKTLHGAGVAILESLDLSPVPDGRYELLAAPLKLAGADAAPLRALLRDL
ncbi:MAG TPA: cyclase family protein [Planctomycetota bacterium]|nr:cyclase family protein [Planctomycetota bacterium]